MAVTTAIAKAEVKTLEVGGSRVTMSVARQLDHVQPERIRPLGRVRLDRKSGAVTVIGVTEAGVLVQSSVSCWSDYGWSREWRERSEKFTREWRALPLLVLG